MTFHETDRSRTSGPAKGAASADIGFLQRLPRFSHGESGTGNLIIQGDNLRVLEGLSDTYKEKVRCIYIDPPYNNGESYSHYHDRMDHEQWLYEVSRRVALLREFLRPDGSLWVSIDDGEVHYLKVAIDRIFGRGNFVTTITWEHRTTRENRKVFSNNHEYVLVYAKHYREFKKKRNLLPLTSEIRARYKNPDSDPRGPWQSVSANVQAGHGTLGQFYEIVGPSGRRHNPPNGRCWVYTRARMQREIANDNIWFGKTGDGVPRIKKFLSDQGTGVTPETLWQAGAAGTTDSAKKHLLQLFSHASPFDTPKPEELLGRIIRISTDPGDLVLDCYLGSGTTTAVAHKLGRRYIGIECGEHAKTYCAKRMRMVVDGESGGISNAINWTGGGGFEFYRIPRR